MRDIHRRTPTLLGREPELAELTTFATGSDPYKWLVGGAWAGKTALCAEAISAALPSTVDVAAYFLSRREADADSGRFIAAVVPQLAYLLDEDSPVPGLDTFRALWDRAVKRAAASGRHLLLVVDGLDEDLRPRGMPSVASLLPTHVDVGAHVLVTSRPNLVPDVLASHPLRSAQPVELAASPYAEHLAELARRELVELLHGEDENLAVEVLGVLTAAAGPLAVDDIAVLAGDQATVTPAFSRQVYRLVAENAARSLQPTGQRRYQFAHGSLLEQAETDENLRFLRHPDFGQRIGRWADEWRNAGWPTPAGEVGATPRYLLDEYPATLRNQPGQLAALAGDVAWVAAALETVGVDRVLALGTAQYASARAIQTSAVLAMVQAQAANLRDPQLVCQPGYVLRQLCLQALESGETQLAASAQARLQVSPQRGPVPLWTTRRTSPALSLLLGYHEELFFGAAVRAVTLLPDGRVLTVGIDRRMLAWDPANPGSNSIELGHCDDSVLALAALPDGRVITGDYGGRVLVWDFAGPGVGPVEFGGHNGKVDSLAVLPDGRVVSSGNGVVLVFDPSSPGANPVTFNYSGQLNAMALLPDGRVAIATDNRLLTWDPAALGSSPVELGRCDHSVLALAALPDGRVVSGGAGARLLVWDPATPGADPAELGRQSADALAALPDGRVVSGGRDGRVLVWDPASAGTASPANGGYEGAVEAVAWLPDGRAVTAGRGLVLAWDPAVPGGSLTLLGRHDLAEMLAVLPDGRVVSGGDECVMVWDPATPGANPVSFGREEEYELPDFEYEYPDEVDISDFMQERKSNEVYAMAVLPDGRVVSGWEDGCVMAWDPASPSVNATCLAQFSGEVTALTVLPDGRLFAIGEKGRVLEWDPDGRKIDLGYHRQLINTLAVLPDGKVAATGPNRRLLVWDLTTLSADPIDLGPQDDAVTAIAALPDGQMVIATNRHMHLWDVQRQSETATVTCSVKAITVALDPAGRHRLLTGGKGAAIWSVFSMAAG